MCLCVCVCVEKIYWWIILFYIQVLTCVKGIHNRLQNEKSRLVTAIQVNYRSLHIILSRSIIYIYYIYYIQNNLLSHSYYIQVNYPSIYLSIYLLIHLSINLSIYLPIHLSIYLGVWGRHGMHFPADDAAWGSKDDEGDRDEADSGGANWSGRKKRGCLSSLVELVFCNWILPPLPRRVVLATGFLRFCVVLIFFSSVFLINQGS